MKFFLPPGGATYASGPNSCQIVWNCRCRTYCLLKFCYIGSVIDFIMDYGQNKVSELKIELRERVQKSLVLRKSLLKNLLTQYDLVFFIYSTAIVKQ